MARASENEITGDAGERFVGAQFADLKFAVADDFQDIGTDLLVLLRDERRFDLGMFAGVQVKSGSSYFEEPGDVGGASGWWFREGDGDHLDSWASWHAPHLLVLHDEETKISYWVNVVHDAVVSTGKGAKIFVPEANVLDRDNRQRLLETVLPESSGQAYEGSAWNANLTVPPRERLRHALIAPRLIAPHPNLGCQGELDAEQAIGLLGQVRISDLMRYLEEARLPELGKLTESAEWGWRLVFAFAQRIMEGEVEGLRDAIADADKPWERAAATVMTAAALVEVGSADDAIPIVAEVLATDDAPPVDHAWLRLAQARAEVEVGQLTRARKSAVDLLAIAAQAPNDVTARSIAGSAAVVIFNAGNFSEASLADVVSRSDTATVWWRAQTTGHGLRAALIRGFKDWAQDRSTTIGAEDVATNRLTASALTASHEGDQAGWCGLEGLRARDALMRSRPETDPDLVTAELNALRLTGHDKDLVLAAEHVALDGPATAVTQALNEVDLDKATKTSAYSDLKLLEVGGDLASEELANGAVEWLLSCLEEPDDFIDRTTPTYLLRMQLSETLSGLAPVAGVALQREIADYLIGVTEPDDDLHGRGLARVVYALDEAAWAEIDPDAIAHAAAKHGGELERTFLGAAARRGDQDARDRLLNHAREGKMPYIAELEEGDRKDPEIARAVLDRDTKRLQERMAEARAGGGISFGARDAGEDLLLDNVRYGVPANWEPIFELLDDDIATSLKIRALKTAALVIDEIDPGVRERLGHAGLKLSQEPLGSHSPFEAETSPLGPGTVLAFATGAIEEGPAIRVLQALQAGGVIDRQWACHLAARLKTPESAGWLLASAGDRDPLVRARAAESLTLRFLDGDDSATVTAGIEHSLEETGTRVPLAVASVLEAANSLTESAETYLERLDAHPSNQVQRRARLARGEVLD